MKRTIRLTESEIRNVIRKCVREALNERDIYRDQWEDEIRMFFNGLKKGTAYVDDNMVAVEWPKQPENDPRWIVYEFGNDYLTDGHFSAQRSRALSQKELKDIAYALKVKYNINKDDTFPFTDETEYYE